MNCKICGAENPSNAKFCQEYGRKLDNIETAATQKGKIKICQSCGAQNPIDAQYCRQCGQSLSEIETTDSITKDVSSLVGEAASLGMAVIEEVGKAVNEVLDAQAESRNDTVCPFCGATNCQPMQKSIVDATYKNYRWGSGCCGLLLLGPFGLLCGLCGTGINTKTQNELWWTCLKCGKQHLALADALKKWDMMIGLLFVNSLTIGISFMVMRLITKWLEWNVVATLLGIIALVGPFMGMLEFDKEISEELGGDIGVFLSPEQKKACVWKVVFATVLVFVIVWLGIPLLGYILGE